MPAHIIKTVRKKSGRQYKYWYYREYRRIGKKVRPLDTYIGPVGLAVGAMKIAIKVASDKMLRDHLFKPIEKTLQERAARNATNRAFDAAPTRIEELTASGWKPEHFVAEAQNHASGFRGVEASQPSEISPPSPGESATPSGE